MMGWGLVVIVLIVGLSYGANNVLPYTLAFGLGMASSVPDMRRNASVLLYTVHYSATMVKTRLRDPTSWLPVAAGASSRNLVFNF